MTVNQAREAYPASRGGVSGYDKALVPVDIKLKARNLHYLQASFGVCTSGCEWIVCEYLYKQDLYDKHPVYAFSQFFLPTEQSEVKCITTQLLDRMDYWLQ